MSKREPKRNVPPGKQAERPHEYRVDPSFELRDWDDCMRALSVAVLNGKGGMTPYDPSKHYIKETGEALRAWVVQNCCEDGGRFRAAGAGVSLRAALCRIDTMATWLRFHGKDGLAAEVEERAKALLARCPFHRYPKDDSRRTAQDNRTFDRVKLELWIMANDFQGQLKRLLVLGAGKGEAKGADPAQEIVKICDEMLRLGREPGSGEGFVVTPRHPSKRPKRKGKAPPDAEPAPSGAVPAVGSFRHRSGPSGLLGRMGMVLDDMWEALSAEFDSRAERLADLVKALDPIYDTATFYNPAPVSVWTAYPKARMALSEDERLWLQEKELSEGKTEADADAFLVPIDALNKARTKNEWTKMQWPGYVVQMDRHLVFISPPPFVHAFDRRFNALKEWAAERARQAGAREAADGERLALDYTDGGGIVNISCPPRPPAGAPESERLEWLVLRCKTLQPCFSGPAGHYPNCKREEARDWLATAYSAACDWLPPATVGECEHLATFDAADRNRSAAREELARLARAATTRLLELHQEVPTGEPDATPETDASLIYQADGADFYNIPKSVLCKAAKKKPSEPGYLWSGRGYKGKKMRVWHRKKDLEKIARSRKALGRASKRSATPDEKPPAPVAPYVSDGKNYEENAKAFLAKIGQEDTDVED